MIPACALALSLLTSGEGWTDASKALPCPVQGYMQTSPDGPTDAQCKINPKQHGCENG